MATKDPATRVALADLIDYVADQLAQAETRASARSERVMQFETAVLELAVSIETGGKGGLKVWVLELGGGRTKTDSNTITVTLKALPGGGVTFPAEGEGSGPKLGRGT
jgi:hypothetical protein